MYKLSGIDTINKITKSRIIDLKDSICIEESEIKGFGYFLFVFPFSILFHFLYRFKSESFKKISDLISG